MILIRGRRLGEPDRNMESRIRRVKVESPAGGNSDDGSKWGGSRRMVQIRTPAKPKQEMRGLVQFYSRREAAGPREQRLRALNET